MSSPTNSTQPLARFEALYGQVPDVPLAHYTDAGGLSGIMRAGAMWATHAQYLNDAREFSHSVDLARQSIARRTSSDPLSKKLLAQLDAMEGNAWVVSFSEEPNLLSQWRAYCPEGGYSISFNSAAIAALAAAQKYVLVKCVYDPVVQQELIDELISAAFAAFPSYSHTLSDGSTVAGGDRADYFSSNWFFPKMLRLGCSLKDPAFYEEKEWRLLGGLYKPHIVPKTRVRGSLLVPYREFSLRQDDLIRCVERVLIGPMPNPQLAAKGLFFLRQSVTAANFEIHTAKTPLRAPPK